MIYYVLFFLTRCYLVTSLKYIKGGVTKHLSRVLIIRRMSVKGNKMIIKISKYRNEQNSLTGIICYVTDSHEGSSRLHLQTIITYNSLAWLRLVYVGAAI